MGINGDRELLRSTKKLKRRLFQQIIAYLKKKNKQVDLKDEAKHKTWL